MRHFSSLFLALALIPCAADAKGPLVTNCADLARIAAEAIKTDTNCEFDIVAKVSYARFHPGYHPLVFEDKTGAVLTHYSESEPIRDGDTIRARGKVGYRWIYTHAAKILSHGSPAASCCISLTDISTGRFDYRLVTLKGTVRDVFRDEIDSHYIWLVLASDNQQVYASCSTAPDDDIDIALLHGAEITLTGVCEPRPHPSRKHLGRSITVGSPKDIRILSDATSKMFNTPTINNLPWLSPPEISRLDRRRVQGRVLAVWNTNHILLKTLNDKISLIKTRLPHLPQTGIGIEVSGFPETDLYHINLSQADWIPADIPVCTDEQPNEITAKSVLSEGVNASIQPRLHGCLVKIKGILKAKSDPTSGSYRLYLESDSTLVPIQVDSAASLLPNLELDSTIEATGVCVMDIEHWSPSNPFPKITGFFVVTRSPEDIVVVARPSWWTPARLMAVIGGLVALIVVILVWNVSLRVLAERRGRALFKARIGNATAKLKVEERTHLAIELHDTIAQNLTGVSMELASAADLGEGASPEMLHHLGIATKALKSCRDELRYCLFDLRNQALEEPSFKVAVEKTLQPHLNGAKLAVHFNVPRKELHDNTAQALLRAIRELAVNAVRHGKATSIKLAGELDADGLRCSVRDNGCGFDPDTCPGVLQGHFGLQGVRERIEGLGGAFDISSTPGKGTKAVITIRSPKVTDEENA